MKTCSQILQFMFVYVFKYDSMNIGNMKKMKSKKMQFIDPTIFCNDFLKSKKIYLASVGKYMFTYCLQTAVALNF